MRGDTVRGLTRNLTPRGTAVSKTYQENSGAGQPTAPESGEIAVPEQVVLSLAEIAASVKESLLTLAVGAGLQVMQAMFDEDVAHGAGLRASTTPGRRVPAWHQGRIGDAGRAPDLGDPAAGAGRRRVRGAALARL